MVKITINKGEKIMYYEEKKRNKEKLIMYCFMVVIITLLLVLILKSAVIQNPIVTEYNAEKVNFDDENNSQYNTEIAITDIANKIEATMSYPGIIKVNVIRETRAIEYAK